MTRRVLLAGYRSDAAFQFMWHDDQHRYGAAGPGLVKGGRPAAGPCITWRLTGPVGYPHPVSPYWRSLEDGVPLENRRTLLVALEQVRNSRVLTYIMSDRATHPDVAGFSTLLDQRPFLLLVDHLRSIGHVPRLDLFLYTRGGETDAVWPLVCLLREYTDHLSVLVPFRAHSGGTLICLGADELVLGTLAELSPIDPTTGNQFNPVDPANPRNRYGISVEDVTSFFKLAEKNLAQQPIADQELSATAAAGKAAPKLDPALRLEVFRELTKQVHPLALGNVERVYLQIRRLATHLLGLHLDEKGDGAQIEDITRALTQEFYSHVHAIPRREAMPLLGDWARGATEDEDARMTDLFDAYATDLQLRAPFSLPTYMGTDPVRDLTAVGGFIESGAKSHIHETRLRVMQRAVIPPGIQVQIPPGATPPLDPWPGRVYETATDALAWVDNVGGS